MPKWVWSGVALWVAAAAHAQEPLPPPPPDPAVTVDVDAALHAWLAERRDDRGRSCELRGSARSGALRYLACGEAGVWVVRLTPGAPPQVVGQRATAGSATAFFVRDGTLWIETTIIQAERLGPVEATATVDAAPLPADATTRSAKPSAAPKIRAVEPVDTYEPALARVVAVEPGYAVIDMGSVHGVQSGDRVAFERVEIEQVGFEPSHRARRVAIGVTTAVARTRARVALGLGERVEIGMSAHPTRDPISATSLAPPRLGALWHAGFIARPFLVVDDVGAGIAIEGRAGYRWEFPLHLEVLIKPVALASGRDGAITPMAGILSASFDSKLFEVGLGVGGQTVHDPDYGLDTGSGSTLAQRVRIGAVDGTMLELLSYIVLFHSEFQFSDLHLNGQIRVSDRAWLVANAGGGALGFGFADVGLRVMVNGNGDRGTTNLTATIGGVHVHKILFDGVSLSSYGTIEYFGPMLGFGADWRF